MGRLSEIIPFSQDNIELYLDFDYEYFQNRIFDLSGASEEDRLEAQKKYVATLADIAIKRKSNKKQTLLFLEGNVRKMHSGGLLTSLFNLSEVREVIVMDFPAHGENQAYFEVWRKHKQRTVWLEKFWEISIKAGSILAILLTILKIIEAVRK